jgi:hypothetical protein
MDESYFRHSPDSDDPLQRRDTIDLAMLVLTLKTRLHQSIVASMPNSELHRPAALFSSLLGILWIISNLMVLIRIMPDIRI